jgi:hypothetical protein
LDLENGSTELAGYTTGFRFAEWLGGYPFWVIEPASRPAPLRNYQLGDVLKKSPSGCSRRSVEEFPAKAEEENSATDTAEDETDPFDPSANPTEGDGQGCYY